MLPYLESMSAPGTVHFRVSVLSILPTFLLLCLASAGFPPSLLYFNSCFPPSLPSRSSSVTGQKAHRACPFSTSLHGGSSAIGLARCFMRDPVALSETSRVGTTTLRLGPADRGVERGCLVGLHNRAGHDIDSSPPSSSDPRGSETSLCVSRYYLSQ